MKYLIVSYDEYINTPYIKNYEKALADAGNEYDIILWNRRGRQETEIPNSFSFTCKTGRSKLSKILPFLQWRRFALDIIAKGSYDRLIILTTIPGVLIADKLKKQFKGRYWLDIRDFTYENILLYKKIVAGLCKDAAVVSISSEPFRSFIPEDTAPVLSHNITNADAESAECTLDKNREHYTFGFVGGIRYPEQNKKILSGFAGSRYNLKYVGKVHTSCDLEPFCRENGIDNVEFEPAYDNSQKPEIYSSIDIINSIYGAETPVERLALPNKLYDCILYKKPIVVSKRTWLAEIVEKYNLGFSVELGSDDAVRMMDKYIENFDKDKFEHGCRSLLEKVKRENILYCNKVQEFCSEKS